MRRKLLMFVLACATSWCQDRAAQYFGSKATPADLSISCRVDPVARTAAVTITNQTQKRCYFQRSSPLINYEAIVTTGSGKRLPQLTQEQVLRQRNPSSKFLNMSLSSTLVGVGPKEAYTGSFSLFGACRIAERRRDISNANRAGAVLR